MICSYCITGRAEIGILTTGLDGAYLDDRIGRLGNIVVLPKSS